jgi:hypothetical protein
LGVVSAQRRVVEVEISVEVYRMKACHFLLGFALASAAGSACAYQQRMFHNFDDPAGKGVSVVQAREEATRTLKVIEDALGAARLLACNRCRSGFALKVVEQALQNPPTLSDGQYAEVERLRAEGQVLYNQGKYAESLELLQKAQSILGIDSSGAIQTPPATDASGAAPTSFPVR